jgi:predicted ATPase
MEQRSSPKPLLSRDLVGRARELEQLGESLHRAAAGRPQFVLLSGEAGVGKTRLCRAFLEQSREEHSIFFWGSALPQDQEIPLGLFLDAFRPRIAQREFIAEQFLHRFPSETDLSLASPSERPTHVFFEARRCKAAAHPSIRA